MIYDVNSALFRSFLSQKGAGDKRKPEVQQPGNQQRAPKANENKPVMNE
ncbi:wound-induced basic protein [Physcomitrium patens]|nr:wound-induced basic protein-like [Physcomitrium patens]|eukprot:XP_024358274.1 wound-induced basic protein-like [Physcomitrella patens]